MVKRKRPKGQTTIYKHTHTTKDRVTQTPLKSGAGGNPHQVVAGVSCRVQCHTLF